MNNADYDVRQREIDDFEAQRAAYNDAFSRMMAQGGEVKSLTDEVAAAGRGGDELLAYLSPESVEFLKEQGGSGTINPETGLPELFIKVLGQIPDLRAAEAAAAAKAAEDARIAKAAANKAAADAQELANFRAAADAKAVADAKAATDARAAAVAKAATDRAAADASAKATLAAIPINKVATPTLALSNPSVSTPRPTPTTAPAMVSSIPYTPPATPNLKSVLGMKSVGSQSADAPVSMSSMSAVPDYTNRGVGAVGPISAVNAVNATGTTPSLSPMMLGGLQNAGTTTDRLGNQIYAPGAAPLYGFARGGGVDVNALLAQNTETLSDEVPDEVINTDPVGTAQKMLADLGNLGKVSPVRQSIKRVRTAPGGGATADKSMQMPYEGLGRGDLGAMKDVTPAAKNTDSARAQMEELARVYQLKIRAAQDKGKGLSANTFGAPTLEGPTLTKNKLTKKRFAEGGEAKKSNAVADIGKWLKNNDINPSDFLTALGRVGSVAGAALTPGELNKGEDAELARRRAMPPTVDRAGGSPEGGETKKDEGPSVPSTTGVNRVLDFIAQRLPADSFPTSARTLLETVQGKKEPITESNFSPKELNVLRQLIESTGGRGNVQYADYIKFMRQQQQEKGTLPASIAPGPFSIIDPIGNVQTTLGRFAYSRDADGNLVVADSYDFNPIREMSGVYGALRNYAGEKIPPGKGREVKINLGKPVERAEGSPVEGELSQEELDAASRPAFVTPSSGKGRKQGEISKQLKSGDAYINMAKGVTEMPYNLAGAPMDIAMLVRQGLTGQAPAGQVGTSDYIKSKMTELGIRPAPPSDSTSKGFYTAGDLLSNLVNPAGVTRAGVKAAEKTGQAVGGAARALEDLTVGEVQRARIRKAGRKAEDTPDTAYDPLRERLEAIGNLAYAVRPTGSTMLTGRRGADDNVITVSTMDQLLADGISNAGNAAGQNTGQAKLIAEFWDKKARNYFERQFGTPDDPVMEGIKAGRIKGKTLASDLQLGFPRHLIDSLALGKTRYKEGAKPEGFVGPGAPTEGRFFPKYPEAVEDFTRRYDEATSLKGNLFTTNPAAAKPDSTYDLSQIGRDMSQNAADLAADKLIAQGVRPELINTNVGTVARSTKDPKQILGDGTYSARKAFDAFEQAMAPSGTNEPGKAGLLNRVFGESRPAGGTDETKAAANILPENVLTAFQKNEPVYDINSLQPPLRALFKPASINEYLASLPPSELANIRFEDAIRGGLKLAERAAELNNVFDRVKTGKRVADSVFSDGVSAPLLQIKEGPLEGFAWKRIEERQATVPEGAHVGHSVHGYELGGPGYTKERQEGFNTGLYRIYTLRDNRNRPVNTVEVRMLDEFTPVVMQVKGNGRATGNVPAANYDKAVLEFFEKYLHPAKIQEEDQFLTPLLQKYKENVNAGFKMP